LVRANVPFAPGHRPFTQHEHITSYPELLSWFEASPEPTPEHDAEDFGLLVHEAREMQGVSAAELARRTGVPPSDVLEFEAGRVVPAGDQFSLYMRALGFVA
jgi:ribosome-binding protein aMBF1 (putative translation factor)